MHLLAVCQFRLAIKAGYKPSEKAPNIEALLKKLGVGQKGKPSTWWYKDLVLLAVVRNEFVHGLGSVALPNRRLTDAAWSPAELSAERTLTARGYADVLRFKRAVRTALNELTC
jgi:hypothetical protein